MAEDASLEVALAAMKISAFNSSPATKDEVELIAALRIAAAVDIAAMNVREKNTFLILQLL